ncbi:unnamed protein product [Chondrus crispus]|uniref:Uncharacterized protein n=1 Tax=Chondrus crispus TaxID=2769 RepID=R7QHT8_CHOCR|nr:unnamed protein product [Chondrus crispus]CDF37016.1 unnamed protein product [Chondrus crispus]|eukprot:XP_005716835.1 unnamed protein product [Chondrus crispus]
MFSLCKSLKHLSYLLPTLPFPLLPPSLTPSFATLLSLQLFPYHTSLPPTIDGLEFPILPADEKRNCVGRHHTHYFKVKVGGPNSWPVPLIIWPPCLLRNNNRNYNNYALSVHTMALLISSECGCAKTCSGIQKQIRPIDSAVSKTAEYDLSDPRSS